MNLNLPNNFWPYIIKILLYNYNRPFEPNDYSELPLTSLKK